ncbi:MAG: hypothetical protein EOM85_04085 [Candidatus Moranbacteria bacterium]|nr:hypothetical protein [Candidatus Moranbacteria bacterium]
MENSLIQNLTDKPLFTPSYLNVEYLFSELNKYIQIGYSYLTDSETWATVGLISGILSVFCITVIVYTLVRVYELRLDEKEDLEKKISDALFKKKEKERNANPRWHYILNLVESLNSSDWRVAVIEADTMLEDILKDRGLTGESVGELLQEAKNGGYQYIDDAWAAHLVRNQIAHEGSDFAFNQAEARRTIKQFENFFESLGVI